MVSLGGVEYASLQNANLNQRPGVAGASWQVTHAYAYDANGNRLRAPNSISTPAYDVQDRLLSYNDCSYSYKNEGSLHIKLCSDGVTSYDYDASAEPRPGQLRKELL